VVLGLSGDGGADVLLPVEPVYYEINTTASISGVHSICMAYDPSQVGPVGSLALMHYTAGAWANITTSNDPGDSVICGATATFSPFAIMQSSSAPPVGGVSDLLVPGHDSSARAGASAALAAGLAAVSGLVAAGWVLRRRRGAP
jgi:hypothetical protein